jgi:tetratricopeptide (TPR) repeat protein
MSLTLSLIAGLLSGCFLSANVRKQKYFESGKRYFDKGEFEKAVIQFTNAIKADPNYADAHFQLGESYLRLKMANRAYQELSRTIELRPDNYKARIDLANLLVLSREFPQAQEQTDLLLKQRPNDPAVHSAVSGLLAGENNLPAAIGELQKTITLDPGHWELYVGLGFLEQRNNQPDAAEASFKKAIELNPKSIQPLLVLGSFYESQKREGDAEQQFRDAIAVDPKVMEPREALARLLLVEGKKSEAEQVLKQANRDLPHEPGSFLALSNFYYATGDLDKAVAEYDALYHERPKDLQIKKRYIELLILAKRIDEARKLNDEILKSDPNDENALVFRSQMQIGWGDEARATETLQTVVKNTPNNSQAHYALGVAYEKQGNLEHAESEWREALKVSPNLVEAQRALAGAAMRLGDMTTLADAATQVIRLQPGSPDGYALRAVANINRQHVAEAESDIHTAIAVAPQSDVGYVQLGNLERAEKQYGDAAKAYQDALDRNANSTDALLGLMSVDIAQKQIDKAIDAAKAQIAKSPNNSRFYDMLGSALSLAKRDPGQVQAAFEKSVALDNQNYDAWIHLVQAHAVKGDIDQAISLGEQSLKANAPQPNLYILLGGLYQSKRDWKKAEDAYQKALAINSQNPVAANELARLMLSTGENLDVALSLAQTAGKGLPNSPAVADTLGWIYYRKGVYPLAVNYLQEALGLEQKNNMPDNPDIHYHLGWAYEKTQRPELSRQNFEQVLKTSPNYPAAAEIKKELSHLKS